MSGSHPKLLGEEIDDAASRSPGEAAGAATGAGDWQAAADCADG